MSEASYFEHKRRCGRRAILLALFVLGSTVLLFILGDVHITSNQAAHEQELRAKENDFIEKMQASAKKRPIE
ncbi:hypothetical protein BH11CYA1_BH11CYA1_29170 [soil metagenome]